MSKEISVDVDGLREHAKRFGPLADRAGDVHRALRGALSGGACWGDDEAGRSFAQVHAEDADATLSRLGGLSDKLADVGEKFLGTANDYAGADEHGARALHAVRPDGGRDGTGRPDEQGTGERG
ncbi:MAG: hypothetical protein J2O49_04365 [Sciscionella sp.]|nr:hypothetical protein [Sciscionella sp.]